MKNKIRERFKRKIKQLDSRSRAKFLILLIREFYIFSVATTALEFDCQPPTLAEQLAFSAREQAKTRALKQSGFLTISGFKTRIQIKRKEG